MNTPTQPASHMLSKRLIFIAILAVTLISLLALGGYWIQAGHQHGLKTARSIQLDFFSQLHSTVFERQCAPDFATQTHAHSFFTQFSGPIDERSAFYLDKLPQTSTVQNLRRPPKSIHPSTPQVPYPLNPELQDISPYELVWTPEPHNNKGLVFNKAYPAEAFSNLHKTCFSNWWDKPKGRELFRELVAARLALTISPASNAPYGFTSTQAFLKHFGKDSTSYLKTFLSASVLEDAMKKPTPTILDQTLFWSYQHQQMQTLSNYLFYMRTQTPWVVKTLQQHSSEILNQLASTPLIDPQLSRKTDDKNIRRIYRMQYRTYEALFEITHGKTIPTISPSGNHLWQDDTDWSAKFDEYLKQQRAKQGILSDIFLTS